MKCILSFPSNNCKMKGKISGLNEIVEESAVKVLEVEKKK